MTNALLGIIGDILYHKAHFVGLCGDDEEVPAPRQPVDWCESDERVENRNELVWPAARVPQLVSGLGLWEEGDGGSPLLIVDVDLSIPRGARLVVSPGNLFVSVS